MTESAAPAPDRGHNPCHGCPCEPVVPARRAPDSRQRLRSARRSHRGHRPPHHRVQAACFSNCRMAGCAPVVLHLDGITWIARPCDEGARG